VHVLILGLVLAAAPVRAARRSTPPPPSPPPAAVPDATARIVPCPLDGLPDAQLAVNERGHLWFLEAGDVLYFTDLGQPLTPGATEIRCQGTRVRVESVQGGVRIGIYRSELDLAGIVIPAAQTRSPEARARRAAEQALDRGDLAGARAALAA
jgi:hypothetical protein